MEDEKLNMEIGEAFTEMHKTLWYKAFSKLGDAEAAMDIVGDVFVKILSHAQWWQQCNSTVRHRYVYDTLDRLCSEWLEREQRFYLMEYCEDLENDLAVELPVNQILDEILVSSYIERLSRSDRELLEMFYYQGMTAAEIAYLLKKKEATVHQMISRARRKLKRFIETKKPSL